MSDIWLVRHGATEWSEDGRHTGRTDIPLLAAGRELAAHVAPALAGHDFALVLSSPLGRARETAALAGFPDAESEPLLHEWDYGVYEGVTTTTIRAEVPGWSVWDGAIPGGESIDQVAARARQVLDRASSVDGDVLLFAHGHILRVLTAVYLGLDPHEGRRFVLDPATVSVLGHEHEWPALRRWNDSP